MPTFLNNSSALLDCFNNTAEFWDKNLDKTLPDFNKEYTFDEYKLILNKYSKNKDYPLIN